MANLIPFIPMLSNNFNDFTYLKREHFLWFIEHDYDKELFGYKVNPDFCTLKMFTDLIVFIFILQNIPPGSKMLDVGGGNSRILAYFKDSHECWNVDKLEGVGSGPKRQDGSQRGIRLVQDYIGSFNQELPENYFDFVFSISALEHTSQEDPKLFDLIIDDLQRVLRSGGYSLHCFDIILKPIQPGKSWSNPLLYKIFQRIDTINCFTPLEQIENATDIYLLSEDYFNNSLWRKNSGRKYREFGYPSSYQVLWRK